MGDIRFITANPGAQGFDDMSDRLYRQEAREEQRRRLAEDRGVDEALRQGLTEKYAPRAAAPAGPQLDPEAGASLDAELTSRGMAPRPQPAPARPAADPVVSRLAATPGGGKLALGVDQQQERVRAQEIDRYSRIAMLALGKGDMDTFNYYNQKGQLGIPPEVGHNAEMRSLVSRGALLGQQHYRSDPQAAQRFAQTFFQTKGDVMAAWKAAGTPRGAVKPVNIKVIEHGNQRLYAKFSQGGEYLGLVTGPGGEPAKADPGVRSGGVQRGTELTATAAARLRALADRQASERHFGKLGRQGRVLLKGHTMEQYEADRNAIFKSYTGRNYDDYAPAPGTTPPGAPGGGEIEGTGPDGKPVRGRPTGRKTEAREDIYVDPNGGEFVLEPDEAPGGAGDDFIETDDEGVDFDGEEGDEAGLLDIWAEE